MGEVIAILSGKGGTGKTSICGAVAAAMSQVSKSVLCIDCDACLRSLDLALGISEMDALCFTDIYSGAYSLEQAAVHPEYAQLRFLTAPVNVNWKNVDEKQFEKLLMKAKKKYQYVFLDCGPGMGTGFSLPARLADQVILVTDPDPASLRGAARVAQELEKMGKSDVRLIINRIQKKQLAKRKLTVDDMMDETGVALLGLVPEDENVPLAAILRKPLLSVTKKGAAAACCRIASRLQGNSVPIGI